MTTPSIDAAREAVEKCIVLAATPGTINEPHPRDDIGYEIEDHLPAILSALDAVGRLPEHLAAVYRVAPVTIAKLCDEHLDRSGGLLGRVRELALAAAKGGEKDGL